MGRQARLVAILATIIFGLTATAFAQTGAVASYQIQTYQPGVSPSTGTPFQVDTVPASAFVCNQDPPPTPTGVVFNPRRAVINDPQNGTRACILDHSAVLLALPVIASGCGTSTPQGCYVSTITATDDFGVTTVRSAASNPFGRRNPQAAPSGLRLTP